MDQLKQFWALVVDVWNTGVFGVDLGRVFAAVGILFFFLLLRRVFTRLIMHWLRTLTRRTKTEIDDRVFDAVEQPVAFLPVVLGVFLAVEFLPLTGSFDKMAGNLVRSLVVFLLYWVLLKMVEPLSSLLRPLARVFSSEMVDWLVKALRVAVIILGAATILEVWGIQVGPIIAGLGLLGVAVALGAQDLFKNLIAGILILAEKRFQKGDWIRVDNIVEGTVESIGFRSTLVRRFDKAPVFVPNATLSDNAVTNFSDMTFRRIYWLIALEYRTTLEQLKAVRRDIEAYVMNAEEFAKPPLVPTFVRVDSFNDSSIDVMLYCFTKTTNWGEWLEIKERLAYKVKEIVEGHGAGFAFPSQSLYLEKYPDGDKAEQRPAPFVPPDSRETPPASQGGQASPSEAPTDAEQGDGDGVR